MLTEPQFQTILAFFCLLILLIVITKIPEILCGFIFRQAIDCAEVAERVVCLSLECPLKYLLLGSGAFILDKVRLGVIGNNLRREDDPLLYCVTE